MTYECPRKSKGCCDICNLCNNKPCPDIETCKTLVNEATCVSLCQTGNHINCLSFQWRREPEKKTPKEWIQ